MQMLELLQRNTEAAYQTVLSSLIELVNAITAERDYYKEHCKEKED